MFIPLPQLRSQLQQLIADQASQGHQTDGLETRLAGLPDSYDHFHSFALELSQLPLREDWTYVEPDDWDRIQAEFDPSHPTSKIGDIALEEAAQRVETAFLASVCGCVLGKPLEVNPTLSRLRAAFEPLGEWPLRDYVSPAMLDALGARHHSWTETVRGQIHFVEPDDDINYSILGMLLLEKHGLDFTREQLRSLWLHHLPIETTFGPERATLLKAGLFSQGLGAGDIEADVTSFNPDCDVHCGAQIRADAYGYACVGRPLLAAQLAWRDASYTHRRTGVYATMWTAAAIAVAPVVKDPLQIFEIALQFVPRRSRFYGTIADALQEVAASSDWLNGYERINAKYGQYGHCRVFQESGTLMNSLHYAESIGDGICKQVMQGNDTDSYGATSGSLLGLFFGPGHLDNRWLEPFNDDLHTALAWFYDRSLSQVARRMGNLPARIEAELSGMTEGAKDKTGPIFIDGKLVETPHL